jgi:hypothetical protein
MEPTDMSFHTKDMALSNSDLLLSTFGPPEVHMNKTFCDSNPLAPLHELVKDLQGRATFVIDPHETRRIFTEARKCNAQRKKLACYQVKTVVPDPRVKQTPTMTFRKFHRTNAES